MLIFFINFWLFSYEQEYKNCNSSHAEIHLSVKIIESFAIIFARYLCRNTSIFQRVFAILQSLEVFNTSTLLVIWNVELELEFFNFMPNMLGYYTKSLIRGRRKFISSVLDHGFRLLKTFEMKLLKASYISISFDTYLFSFETSIPSYRR